VRPFHDSSPDSLIAASAPALSAKMAKGAGPFRRRRRR